MDRVLARFADPAGGFFDTADDHERLVTRPKDVQDNAVPSGNAMAARVLLRLAAWTGEGRYRAAAERAIRSGRAFVARYPTGFAQWLSAMDLALAPVVEVAIVGSPDDPATAALLEEARRGFRPNQVVAVAGTGGSVGPLLRRSDRDRRPADRLCLPRVRLPAAGHRPRRRCGCGSTSPRCLGERVEARGTRPSSRGRPRPSSCSDPGRPGSRSLLTQRPSTMAFAADMHVFPGGRVDPADADPSPGRSVRRLGEAAAAAALGGDLAPAVALAAHVAAIRELFEEAGVLLGRRDAPRGSTSGARSALRAGEATAWPTLAGDLDLRLRTDLLVPLSRWVTPPILPRRFDARFFAAVLPGRRRAVVRGRRGGRARVAAPDRCARRDGRRRARDVAADEHDAPAARARRSIEEIRERLAPGRSARSRSRSCRPT